MDVPRSASRKAISFITSFSLCVRLRPMRAAALPAELDTRGSSADRRTRVKTFAAGHSQMDELEPSPAEITQLLHEWGAGNRDALDRLMPIVYNELRALASRQLAREWRHDRLQTTTVVNEAYLKLF